MVIGKTEDRGLSFFWGEGLVWGFGFSTFFPFDATFSAILISFSGIMEIYLRWRGKSFITVVFELGSWRGEFFSNLNFIAINSFASETAVIFYYNAHNRRKPFFFRELRYRNLYFPHVSVIFAPHKFVFFKPKKKKRRGERWKNDGLLPNLKRRI